MRRSTYVTVTSATLVIMSLIGGCNRPISDAEKLRAIRAEAYGLMKTDAPEKPRSWKKVPKEQWPLAIAGLHPADVTVHTWGVDIMTNAYFDGGYGYQVPLSKADLPMPPACYSEPARGVFWHNPC